jgi:hypothetical protein
MTFVAILVMIATTGSQDSDSILSHENLCARFSTRRKEGSAPAEGKLTF